MGYRLLTARGWLLTDCLLALCLSLGGGCALMRSASASEPAGDRVMKVTMVPTVRQIYVLERVSHDAPLEGITLREGSPQSLRVVASGTGELGGAIWLEGPAGAVGRANLVWDPAAEQYVGEMMLTPSRVPAGTYDVKAALLADGKQITEAITALDPLQVRVEITLAPSPQPDELDRVLWQVQDAYAYFDSDSDQLAEQERREAQERIVQALLPFKDRIQSIRVEGHCDPRGSEEYNRLLGARRAESLAAMLAERLPGTPVTVLSLGEAPVEPEEPGPEGFPLQRWARVRLRTLPK